MADRLDPSAPAPSRRSPFRRVATILGRGVAWSLVVLGFAWGCAAFWWSPLGPAWLRVAVIALFLLAGVVATLRLRGVPMRLALLGVWLVAFAWFWLAPATNHADWEAPARMATTVEATGDIVTFSAVRNFRWRTESDFDERWERRSYDLSKLRSLDLFMSYWGPTLICHTFLSFGFEDGSHLTASVEVRKKVGQTYAPIPSAFRNFELAYIFADELDLVYVRTNVRRETVHLAVIDAPLPAIRGLLVEYIDRANRLARQPEWYNAITNSCGVNIVQNLRAEGGQDRYSWRSLFNGQWARYAYENGEIVTDQPFEAAFAASVVDEAALRVGYSPEFSRAIREGTPLIFRPRRSSEPLEPPTLPAPGPQSSPAG